MICSTSNHKNRKMAPWRWGAGRKGWWWRRAHGNWLQQAGYAFLAVAFIMKLEGTNGRNILGAHKDFSLSPLVHTCLLFSQIWCSYICLCMSPAQYSALLSVTFISFTWIQSGCWSACCLIARKGLLSSTEISIELPATDVLNCWVQAVADVWKLISTCC